MNGNDIKTFDLKKLDNLVYLDLETTGLDIGETKIIEIAMVKLNGQRRLEYQSLVNPGCQIPLETSKINSIYDDMVKTAPYIKDLAADILEFLGANTIVCHNAGFDLPILFREINFILPPKKEFYYIDTLKLARKFFNFDSNSLGAIADVLGIEVLQQHRAMSDVETLIAASKYLFSNMYRKGIETIEVFLFK